MKNNRKFMSIMLIIAFVLGFVILKDYIPTITLALLLAILFRPAHLKIQKVLKNKSISTLISVITICFVILVPLTVVILISTSQILAVLADLNDLSQNNPGLFYDTLDSVNEILAQLPIENFEPITEEKIYTQLQQLIQPLGNYVLQTIFNLGGSTIKVITNIIVFFSVLAPALNDAPKLINYFKKLSPLPSSIDDMYIKRVIAMSKSMVKGIVIIAVIQGVVTGLSLWIVGVEYVMLWILITTLTAIVPIGAGSVSLPAGIILILTGKPVSGIFVLLVLVLVVMNIDNVLRPKLAPKEANLSELMTLLSLLGGLALFGFYGIIYGPVIMIFIITTIEVYTKYYGKKDKKLLNGKEKFV